LPTPQKNLVTLALVLGIGPDYVYFNFKMHCFYVSGQKIIFFIRPLKKKDLTIFCPLLVFDINSAEFGDYDLKFRCSYYYHNNSN
jgi:hypothetical protein